VGFLAGITVARACQGRGLGAALTAGMTRQLLRAYDVVALGVMSDNAPAIHLYRRLGFTSSLARSSLAIG
jgi:ribosomal protein S18 acetylase RimI-like enzyme